MKTSKNKVVNAFIIGTFVSLYLLVSIISTIHVIEFFKLSNPEWLAISLAIGFEIGAAASLAALITLEKMNKTLVWALFITITAVQIQGNMFYAFINLKDYNGWVELFNLVEWEPLAQKRLLSAVSGAILPLVALGFIKSLVDYIKPESDLDPIDINDLDVIAEEINHTEKKSNLDDISDWDVTLLDGIEIDRIEGYTGLVGDNGLEDPNLNEVEVPVIEKQLVEKVDSSHLQTDDKKSMAEKLAEEQRTIRTMNHKGPLYAFRTNKNTEEYTETPVDKA
jgi:RNA-binding protein YhbY